MFQRRMFIVLCWQLLVKHTWGLLGAKLWVYPHPVDILYKTGSNYWTRFQNVSNCQILPECFQCCTVCGNNVRTWHDVMHSVGWNLRLCPQRLLALRIPCPGRLKFVLPFSWVPVMEQSVLWPCPLLVWSSDQDLRAGLVLMQNSLHTTYASWTAFSGFRDCISVIADKKMDFSVSAKPAIEPWANRGKITKAV